MKKELLTITFLLLLSILAMGQANTERTLVKSFNLKGHNEVVLDFNGDITVERRKSDVLRVQVVIGINNTSSILKSLITAGRYNLKMVEENNQLKLVCPNLKRAMTIGGKKLEESFKYVIQAPEDLSVIYGEQTDLTSTVLNNLLELLML